MKHGPLAARIWAAAVCGISPICLAATMEFESVPVGTKYGGDFGNVPGHVVLTENGIKMSVEQFFFQQFTGIEGRYVSLKDTIRGFQEIVDGKHDDLPEQAFYMVGTIEDAVAKAERLGAMG